MIESGDWNNLPHYSIHGTGTCFYVWVNESGKGSASKWIKGSIAFELYNKMTKTKDKESFISSIKETHKRYFR